MPRYKVAALPVSEVHPDPQQPRAIFDEDAIAELAASIRQNGLLQPITVRPDPAGGGWVILAGERRWRAHRHNNAATIDARILNPGLDAAAALSAQIVENAQRRDLTPLEEAHAYQRLVDLLDGDVERAATRLGVMPYRITERLVLLRLAPEYQGLLRGRQLTPTAAYEMALLAPGNQHRLLTAIKRGQCPNAATLRACALALRESEAQTSIFDHIAAPPPVSAEERQAASRLERKIDLAAQVLGAGFDEGEIVAAKKIDPGRAATYADKLALMQRALAQLEHALRAGIALSLPLSA